MPASSFVSQGIGRLHRCRTAGGEVAGRQANDSQAPGASNPPADLAGADLAGADLANTIRQFFHRREAIRGTADDPFRFNPVIRLVSLRVKSEEPRVTDMRSGFSAGLDDRPAHISMLLGGLSLPLELQVARDQIAASSCDEGLV